MPLPNDPPAPALTCPQCHAPVRADDTDCSNCHVNLALAAALVERQVLVGTPAAAGAPYIADLILPRFGEFLLESRYITQAQLQAALARQREAAAQGRSQTVGQILLEMGAVTREQLDLASIQQVKQLQNSLLESNRQLEGRVAERTQELHQGFHKLSELNQLKANFVMNMSHELRTPLTHIKGYTELLMEDEPLTEDQRDVLKNITLAIAQLDGLLNNLLRFASSSRGEMELHPAAFSLPDLAERVLNASLSKAARGGIELLSEVPPGLPLVMADEEKISWALFQLLDNAIKFTLARGRVRLTAEPRGAHVRISVRDTGIGIPPERRNEVFVPFHQLDSTTTRRYGGTGLGLALVKRIVEAHGSTVEVESQPGKGSSFSFDLPLAPLP